MDEAGQIQLEQRVGTSAKGLREVFRAMPRSRIALETRYCRCRSRLCSFRPAYIQPLHGIRTKTRWYGAAYALMRPLYPLWKMLFPNYVTTTECVGRAMLNVTKRGFPHPVPENRDINVMCAQDSK
jgi:hypothetical protein